MSAALGLYRLQQVDSQLDQIHARLKKIQETLENDSTLRAANEHLASKEDKFKTAEHELKFSEAEFEKQRLKIEQAEASLYGGHVHNPKELQDLQNDVASLKRHLTTLENRELEAMMIFETTEKERNSARNELEKINDGLSTQHTDLMKESGSLQKEIERLDAERKAVMRDLPQLSVQVYDQLRERKRGIAIAAINDSSCGACGGTLTAAQVQTARSGMQFFNCPTCGRILFAN